ncbi:hypothetical protein [Clostridium beijerinckii]|uniref:hypothetical protein n=1 Tax=Clostridium beijerinckii TaxID=1520 RepID=UPI001FA7EC5A|nr:hypothetical protein [Clostridium beijerinckii]
MNLKKVIAYITISYSFTWTLWLPLLLNRHFGMNLPIISGQFYISSFGPFIGAVVTSLVMGGFKSLGEWAKRAYSIRFKSKWVII